MHWKVFYTDGTTFSNEDEGDIPCKGVAVIIKYHKTVGRRVLRLADWYRYEDGEWYECGEFDILYNLAMRGSITALRGQYMLEDEFEQILIRSVKDPDLPPITPKKPPNKAWSDGR